MVSRRVTITAGVIIVALVAGALFGVSSHSGPDEPAYGGRTLRQWYHDYREAHSAQIQDPYGPQRRYDMTVASMKAVESMGTNAIPILLEWLGAEPHPVRESLGALCQTRYARAWERRMIASWALSILKEKAKTAAPAIAQLTKSKNGDVRQDALECLVRVGPERAQLLPVLTRLLKDPRPSIRQQAAMYLIGWYPADADKIGLHLVGPGIIDWGTNLIGTN